MTTTLRQIDRETTRVTPGAGYVVEFMVHKDGADVFIISDDGDESFRVRLEGPKPGQSIAVMRNEDGSFDVTYKESGYDQITV